MPRRLLIAARLGATVIASLACIAATGASASSPPTTQALPTPFAFVSNLDLECFKTAPYTPPFTTPIVTRHLNPVLAGLPTESHVLGPRNQLCVPVAKNNRIPPPEVLAFIRFVDLSCYQIQGQTVNFPLNLRHLNPLLTTLPGKNTVMVAPEQLCLPVIKNNVVPPAEVFNLVRYIDLKCYRETNQTPLGIGLGLTQLNPVLGNIPPTTVSVRESRQLCVPVQKNAQPIPADVFNVVRWIDLEKYDILAPAPNPPITLSIRHINPLLVNLPAETVTLSTRHQLGLPVAKNGAVPPGAAAP